MTTTSSTATSSTPEIGTPDSGSDDDWLPAGFTVSTVATNGTVLSVAVGGRGPTLVLLHGWPQTRRAWRLVMPPLAEHHTVVVPDVRGAGLSERPLDGYRKTNQARDVRGVLAALDLTGPAVVVGHDIGAMTALAWAAEFPEDVAALVVLDAVVPGLGLEEFMDVARGGMWHFGLFMEPDLPEMLFEGHELEFVTATFRALSNPGTFTDDDLEFYARAYRGRDRLRGGFAHYRELLRDGRDNQELLAAGPLTMPVLAIGGAASTGEGAASGLRPHATRLTERVAPTGHFIAEEAPDWLVRTLNDFLNDSPAELPGRGPAPR